MAPPIVEAECPCPAERALFLMDFIFGISNDIEEVFNRYQDKNQDRRMGERSWLETLT